MQHIQLKNCDSKELMREELVRLTEAGVIPTDQTWETVLSCVWTCFDSDIGRRIRTCPNVLREFKFSVLMDGKRYGHGLEEEKILLQGVVDFALIEEEGITVVDYKTDRVKDADVLLDMYGQQLMLYREAVSQIFSLPVKSCLIYSVHLSEIKEVLV
jgi:ATP-dependent helicase/nuclease subunit A